MELNKYKSDRDKKIKLNNIVNEFDELKKEVARLTNLVEEFIIRK